jgi:hypothetical protein
MPSLLSVAVQQGIKKALHGLWCPCRAEDKEIQFLGVEMKLRI